MKCHQHPSERIGQQQNEPTSSAEGGRGGEVSMSDRNGGVAIEIQINASDRRERRFRHAKSAGERAAIFPTSK